MRREPPRWWPRPKPRPAKSTTVEVEETPEAGPYVMLCPIEGKEGAHYELGQLEEFDVE